MVALCLTAIDKENYTEGSQLFFHLKYKSSFFSFEDSNILQIVFLKKYLATYVISIVLIVIFVFGSTYGTFWCLKWSQCLASLFKVLTYVRKCALWPETSFICQLPQSFNFCLYALHLVRLNLLLISTVCK